MFTFHHIKQLYRLSDKVIVRTLRKARFERVGPNPGLDNRLGPFAEKGLLNNVEDPEEFIEQSESDFSKVGEVYNEQMNETLIGKYELRHRIIKEKYFKENMPNLLTWSEKEQIRYLASSEPDEWTPEKIAESFPVTVPVVKKLLKYPWKPASEERIARHDSSAMRNWKELQDGSLTIPEDIRKHFLKFSNRTIPPLKKGSIKVEIKQEDKIGEFESIVRKCAEKESSQSSSPVNNIALPEPDSKTQVNNIKTNRIKDTKLMTLQELTNKIQKRLEKGSNVHVGDKLIVDSMKSSQHVPNQVKANSSETSYELSVPNENISSDVIKFDNEKKPADIMNYPERIRIPKKAYKKGATYKVDDCYYDHDGRFLYRVLGLTN